MKKPRIEYYWTEQAYRIADEDRDKTTPLVNWRLIAANGEIVCQSSQGHRDKTDARRAVDTVIGILVFGVQWGLDYLVAEGRIREVGPGRKPKAGGDK